MVDYTHRWIFKQKIPVREMGVCFYSTNSQNLNRIYEEKEGCIFLFTAVYMLFLANLNPQSKFVDVKPSCYYLDSYYYVLRFLCAMCYLNFI